MGVQGASAQEMGEPAFREVRDAAHAAHVGGGLDDADAVVVAPAHEGRPEAS